MEDLSTEPKKYAAPGEEEYSTQKSENLLKRTMDKTAAGPGAAYRSDFFENRNSNLEGSLKKSMDTH